MRNTLRHCVRGNWWVWSAGMSRLVSMDETGMRQIWHSVQLMCLISMNSACSGFNLITETLHSHCTAVSVSHDQQEVGEKSLQFDCKHFILKEIKSHCNVSWPEHIPGCSTPWSISRSHESDPKQEFIFIYFMLLFYDTVPYILGFLLPPLPVLLPPLIYPVLLV